MENYVILSMLLYKTWKMNNVEKQVLIIIAV